MIIYSEYYFETTQNVLILLTTSKNNIIFTVPSLEFLRFLHSSLKSDSEKLLTNFIANEKPPRLAELLKAPSLLYGNLRWFKSTRGRKLVVKVCDQQPFEPRKWGRRVR